jgi:hypothetical protein
MPVIPARIGMTAGRRGAASGLGRRGRPDMVISVLRGQVEQVLTFGIVELQHAGHRLRRPASGPRSSRAY